MKVVPSAVVERTSTVPPWAEAICCTMKSPSPSPEAGLPLLVVACRKESLPPVPPGRGANRPRVLVERLVEAPYLPQCHRQVRRPHALGMCLVEPEDARAQQGVLVGHLLQVVARLQTLQGMNLGQILQRLVLARVDRLQDVPGPMPLLSTPRPRCAAPGVVGERWLVRASSLPG